MRTAVVLFVVLTAAMVVPLAMPIASASYAQAKLVSAVPAAFTPDVLDGNVQKLARIGNTMYLGGTFTKVADHTTGATLSRTNLLAFDMTTGKVSTSFKPVVVGGEVSGLATDGLSLFVAGAFTSINGQATRVAKLDPTTGATRPTWVASTFDGRTRDIAYVGGRVIVTGDFTRVGGVPMPALASLRPSDGSRDPFALGVVVQGPFTTGVTNVRKLAINPAGTAMVVVGNFGSISGSVRQQIGILDLTGSSLRLSPWATTSFGPQNHCAPQFDSWIRNVDWSPDGTWFATVTTGAWGGSGSLCDSAARFEYTQNSSNIPTWVDQTGGDSLYSVEVTGVAVYVGGHQRWMNNPFASNRAGAGAVERTGLAALDPRNGMPLPWNPTRDRGAGVFDMMATDGGLWIAHDTAIVAHLTRERVAYFPLAGGQTLPADVTGHVPGAAYLLGRIVAAGSGLAANSVDDVRRAVVSGGNTQTLKSAPGGGIAWGQSRGAVMIDSSVFFGFADGTWHRRTFDGTTWGPDNLITQTYDPTATAPQWADELTTLTSMFWENGRLYYTLAGSTSLYYRSMTPMTGYVSAKRHVDKRAVTGVDWSTVTGAFPGRDGFLYFARADGTLSRIAWTPATLRIPGALSGTATVIAGPGVDQTNWASRSLFLRPA